MSLDRGRLIAALSLGVATLALAASAAALLATSACLRYALPDLFHCGAWGYAAAVTEAIAAASIALFVYSFPSREWPSPTSVSTWIGLAAASVAALSSLLLPLGPTETLFQVAAVGWMIVGIWFVDLSRHGPDQLRSTTGTVVGVTLAVWALYAIFSDDRPVAVGGGLFALVFGYWALRAASRVVRGYERRETANTHTSVARDWIYSSVVALGIVFIGMPLWMASTLGVAPIGDPGERIVIKNDVSKEIVFYLHDYDVGRYSGTRIAPGSEYESFTLMSNTYRVIATDQSGARVYCGIFTRHELKELHWIIVVRNDPASCR